MRWPMRLFLLCTIAVLAAGCGADRPADPGANQSDSRTTFAEVPPDTACMGDFIWQDLNCNGIQDDGEPGLGGVVVKLYECPSDVLVDETVSEADGYYALFGPAPDDYYIVVELPEGCRFSPKDVGQPEGVRDVANDSDVDANGVGYCTNLFDQEIEKNMDVGICCDGEENCPTSIGDRVWFDVNCNGIQDDNELGGPAGLTVDLVNCDTGAVVASTTTDGNGYYLFTNAPEGSYQVCFELPEGYDWSPQDVGDNSTDSDVGEDGCTDCFTLECDKPNLLLDAGLCEKKGDGGDGCTPGFWRNHLTHWAATPYNPGQEVNDVFGCDLAPEGTTLGEAIDAPQTYGVLVFHAIAALLNASHPDVDFDLSEGEVIEAACDGDKDTLADANESGCPLSGGNTTGGGGGGGGAGEKKSKNR